MKKQIKKMKKHIAMVLSLLLILLCAFAEPVDVLAVNDDEVQIPEEPYNSSDSVVQVIYYFQDDDGNNHILQSRSGILIDSTTVVTSHYTTVLGSKSKDRASEYYTSKFETQIRFDDPPEEEKDDWTVYTPKLAVVDEGTVFVDAKVEFDDTSWDVSLLKLDKTLTTQLEFAVLGDSDIVERGDLIKTQGFPNFDKDDQKSFSRNDLMEYDGVVVFSDTSNIKYSGNYHFGFVGGPVIDSYGRVIAIIIYKSDEKENYSSLPINVIKPYLDNEKIEYREDTNDYDKLAEEHTNSASGNDEVILVFDDLNSKIIETTILYNENNEGGLYTKESYEAFKKAYEEAVTLSEMKNVSSISQSTINEKAKALDEAVNNLEKAKKTNKKLLITIIVLCSVFGLLLIVLVVFLIIRGRRKKKEKEEAMRIKTIEGGHGLSGTLTGESNNLRNVGLPSAQLYAQFDAKAKGDNKPVNAPGNAPAPANGAVYMEAGTTILQDEEGTTVLNSFVQAPINAYLYRSKTGESIAVTSENFRIGKNTEGIEYRIDGNTNVSRFHAVITRSNESYYIEDLGSTNYTFVNSVRIMPNRKQQLQSNDVIYLADEEFIFMING